MSIECSTSRCVSVDRLAAVEDTGLHHTLIKTLQNFSTDSRPAAVANRAMLPSVCCCCSNVGHTKPGIQGQGVSMTCLRETRKGKEGCTTFYLGESEELGPRVLSWYFLAWVTREKHFQNLHGVSYHLASWSSFIKNECNYSTQKASWTWLRALQLNCALGHEQFWKGLNDLKHHPWNMF